MGNFLVCRRHLMEKERMVSVLREEDYEFLEYKSPVSVSRVLSDNPGCEIVLNSEEGPLPGDHEMKRGVPYRLIKKSEQVKGAANEKGVLRVRVVLTKKEVAQLLSRSGGDLGSLEDVVAELASMSDCMMQEESPFLSSERWQPMLDTIHEDL